MNLFLEAGRTIPDVLLLNPFSVGFGPQLSDGIGGFGWIIPVAMAGVIAYVAIVLAKHLTATGIAGQESSDRSEKVVDRRNRGGTTIFRGLVLKELLQMRRRPGYVVQILLAPGDDLRHLVSARQPSGHEHGERQRRRAVRGNFQRDDLHAPLGGDADAGH